MGTDASDGEHKHAAGKAIDRLVDYVFDDVFGDAVDDVFGDGTVATIPAVIDRAIARFGDREGFVDDEVHLTFAQLGEHIDTTARGLLGVGVAPGDRIAIWGPNSLRWLLAALGAYRTGAVVVPLNTRFKGSEAAYVLRTAGARLLFTVTDFLGTDYPTLLTGDNEVESLERIVVMSGTVSERCSSWDELVAAGASVERDAVARRSASVRPADISDIMFTSGTTGKPKGAMLRHGATVKAFDAWASVVGLTTGDRYLIVNPFFHTFGLKAGIVASLVKGATIVPQPMFDVPDLMRRVAENKITMLPGPPAIYQTILDHPDVGAFDLSSLRLAVTGAAPVPVELIRRIREELSFETVVTGYGLTETTGIVTMCRHDDAPETISRTSGRVIPGVELKLVDGDGNAVEQGQPGEVLARGYNVMAGYFGDAEATAEVIDGQGWLATGDIGVQDAEGNLTITDRKKDMFVYGGFNVYPAEVETVLATHPDVSQAAVVGVPDERMGEVGAAFIVPRPGATIDPEAMIEWCRQTMANFKVPRHVRIVDALPLNASNKVLKTELRAMFS